MNQLVLSGTATLVLSGTRSSCYRGPESSLRACFSALSSRSNFTNQKSFGFLLTDQSEIRVLVREVSRTGAMFRETAPGFTNWIHKHGTAIRDKGPSSRAFRSGAPRDTHFNFQTRSVRELGTFRSQYANQEPTRLRQPIAKTRILTFADSRNLARRQRVGADRQRGAVNPACLQKPHTHFIAPKSHGSEFDLLGAAV